MARLLPAILLSCTLFGQEVPEEPAKENQESVQQHTQDPSVDWRHYENAAMLVAKFCMEQPSTPGVTYLPYPTTQQNIPGTTNCMAEYKIGTLNVHVSAKVHINGSQLDYVHPDSSFVVSIEEENSRSPDPAQAKIVSQMFSDRRIDQTLDGVFAYVAKGDTLLQISLANGQNRAKLQSLYDDVLYEILKIHGYR